MSIMLKYSQLLLDLPRHKIFVVESKALTVRNDVTIKVKVF